jgi:hypothetical protein
MRARITGWGITGLVLALALSGSGVAQQPRPEPPHAWVFGSWTGGLYPASETSGPRCTGQPSVIFTRDVVLRASVFDVPYRQRLVETVSGNEQVLEFRLVPTPAQSGPLGRSLPADIGFGCAAGPNALRVERRGENEIVFPDCADFPSPLLRCVGN